MKRPKKKRPKKNSNDKYKITISDIIAIITLIIKLIEIALNKK